MFKTNQILRLLAAGAVFATCLGAYGRTPASVNTSPATVFVGDGALNAVFEFPAGVDKPKVLAKITVGISTPIDLATDGAGGLYVLNNANSTITEYAAGSKLPSATIAFPSGYGNPVRIAVGPDGTLYVVANGGYIVEYYAGQTQPSLIISAPSQPPVGVGPATVDRKNNLYWDFYGGSCCGAGTFITPVRSQSYTFFKGSGGAGGALTFDRTGDLLIAQPHGRFSSIREIDRSGSVWSFAAPAANYMSFDFQHGLLYTTYGSVSILDLATKKVFGSIPWLRDATGIAVSPNSF